MPMKMPGTGGFGPQRVRHEPSLLRKSHYDADSNPALDLMEDRATPNEFMGERDAAAAAGDLARVAELDQSQTGRMFAGLSRLEPYVRHELVAGATLYRRAGGADQQRNLLVGFCGRKNRLGLAAPCILQNLDADEWDVILLRDVRKSFYLKGVAGIGGDFAAVIAWLTDQVRAARRTVTCGSGLGGLPAMWAAGALGADHAVSLAAVRPPQHLPPVPFNEAAVPQALYVYNAATASEVRFAHDMAKADGVVPFAAPGKHAMGFLNRIMEQGQLKLFLEIALRQPVDARTWQADLSRLVASGPLASTKG